MFCKRFLTQKPKNMKNILKLIIISWILSITMICHAENTITWSVFSWSQALQSASWSLSTDVKDKLDALNKKKNDLVNELTWNDEVSKKITSLESENTQKTMSIETLEKMNYEYKLKIEALTKESEDIKLNNTDLISKINEYKDAIKLNNSELTKLKSEKINNAMILESLSKLKSDLAEKESKIIQEKVRNIMVAFWFLLFVFVVTEILYNKEKKELEYLNNSSRKIARLNIINVITMMSLIVLIIFSTIYLKPDLAIGFLFFWSALIIIFKDTILSFFASITVLLNYDIGDEIGIDEGGMETNGILVKLTPLYMVIKETMETGGFSWKIIKIPNKTVYEKSILKGSSNYSKLAKDIIILPLLSKGMVERRENLWMPKDNINTLPKIDAYLESLVIGYSLPELWIYSDFNNSKYKKRIFSDHDWNAFIEYSWIWDLVMNETIKLWILNIFYEKR